MKVFKAHSKEELKKDGIKAGYVSIAMIARTAIATMYARHQKKKRRS